MTLTIDQTQRIAGLELNALRATGVLGQVYEMVRIPTRGTPIFDINGTLLFHRLSLSRGSVARGYVDIAAHEVFGEPLLATSMGAEWNEKSLVERGTILARKRQRRLKFNAVRFVAYSYPKVGLQFLENETEVLMLELYTWAVIPPATGRERKLLEPANFERWSLLDEIPRETQRQRAKQFKKRLASWDVRSLGRLDVKIISRDIFKSTRIIIRIIDTREIHYSADNTDHFTCYELRGQRTNVWCVAASSEMLMNFYRYTYDQVRLANELGLGTLSNPGGLPYARVGDVVTVLEKLSSNSLDVTMYTNPIWDTFRDEIRANRPLISFIPGHSRTVAGYTHSLLALPGQIPFRGLLVYDPWPPNAGVITRWENFSTQMYQYAYSAILKHV